MLTNAAGKDDQIHPAQRHTLGGQGFGGAVAKQGHRQLGVVIGGLGIPGLSSRMQAAHVAAEVGDARQPTLPVDQVLQPIGVQRQAAHQVGQHARVQVPTAAAHHQAAGGCQAHAGVHRLAYQHGSDAGAIAQVGNQQPARQRCPQLLHDGRTRQAMKPVALDTLRTQCPGQCQHPRHVRQAGMETSVQAGHLGQCRVVLQRCLHQRQRGGHVQRCKWRGCRQLLQHSRRDAHMLAQHGAAMHHPVADGLGQGQWQGAEQCADAAQHFGRAGLAAVVGPAAAWQRLAVPVAGPQRAGRRAAGLHLAVQQATGVGLLHLVEAKLERR